jgi:carboxypeptidase Taq
MGMHESPSRFFENVIGRSLPFWEGIYGGLIDITDGIFDDVSVYEIYSASNIAKPSLIRVHADELTYFPAHHGKVRN